jgi:hypothetical protein
MVAGLANKSKSNDQYKLTNVSKGHRDERRLPSDAHRSPERRFILRPQISPSDSSVCSEVSNRVTPEPRQQPSVARILDTFTNLCLGGVSIETVKSAEKSRREKQKSRKSSSSHRKRVVYPVASYPVHLNSKKLVEQRRKSLPQHFFRPVSED